MRDSLTRLTVSATLLRPDRHGRYCSRNGRYRATPLLGDLNKGLYRVESAPGRRGYGLAAWTDTIHAANREIISTVEFEAMRAAESAAARLSQDAARAIATLRAAGTTDLVLDYATYLELARAGLVEFVEQEGRGRVLARARVTCTRHVAEVAFIRWTAHVSMSHARDAHARNSTFEAAHFFGLAMATRDAARAA